MKLFLDTEFTDFTNPQLISIGIVDERGREFYAERNDFPREACSNFVVQTVLPLLGQYPSSIVGNRLQIAYALYQWLEEYRECGAVICVDYQTDWDLFIQHLPQLPYDFITGLNIWGNLDLPLIESWWQETGYPRHMALYDARANRHGYIGQTKALLLYHTRVY